MDIEDVISNKDDLFSNIDLIKLKDYIYEIIYLNPKTFVEFDKACIIARRKFKICPKKAQIIHYYRKLVSSNELKSNYQLEKLMIKKLVRGSSGVEVITVLTSPFPSWTTNGLRKTQKFSCGKNCGYCPKEPKTELNCEVINIQLDVKYSTITLKTNNDLSETRVITYIILNNIKISTYKQKNFNKEEGTFDVLILNKYYNNINIGNKCIAVKIEQPRSYISTEPAVMRANRNNFDPVLQFYDRASSLEYCGHIIDKIELLVLGGTWSHYPVGYQEEFIRDLYYSANTYYDNIKRDKLNLEKEKKLNESTKCRVIGLTLETRPDCINKREIMRFRKYGCTRVQIGVQHINNKILKDINRGCYLRHTMKSLHILKQNGYKVDIHLMPDLPGSNYEIDKNMFDTILDINSITKKEDIYDYNLKSPELQADQWKIYPTEVTRWTKIYDMFQDGSYKPYADDINKETGNKKIVDLLISTKEKIFPWIRLNRIIRDIPDDEIFGGNSVISLRQDLHRKMKKEGKVCKCIRCREIRGRKINLEDIKLIIRKYNGVDSDEYFISFESNNESIIYGFCRLRLNYTNNNIYYDCLKDSAIIRELHVYGMMVPHDNNKKKTQHRGFGKRLIKKAEQIAYNNGYKKMAIISGIGVRRYYKKRGYKLEDTYMTKILDFSVINHNNCLFYLAIITVFISILANVIYFIIWK
jgi:ELP3 family radical SAM enzyme/protein acetyltransferase